jgi:hypothetical protein
MPSVCAATTLPGGIARYLCVLAAVGFLATLGVLPVASAGRAQADETVNVCGPYPDEVFGGGAVFGIATAYNCSTAAGAYLDINTAGNTVASGQRGTWQANAPADLLIKDVSVLSFDVSGVNDGNQYGGGFYWPGGGAGVTDGAYSGFFGVDDGDAGFPASYFGFQVVCGASPCTSSGSYIHVEQMALDVEETVGPTLSAGGLWGQQGWVRGNWPISVNGDRRTDGGSAVPSAGHGCLAPVQRDWRFRAGRDHKHQRILEREPYPHDFRYGCGWVEHGFELRDGHQRRQQHAGGVDKRA